MRKSKLQKLAQQQAREYIPIDLAIGKVVKENPEYLDIFNAEYDKVRALYLERGLKAIQTPSSRLKPFVAGAAVGYGLYLYWNSRANETRRHRAEAQLATMRQQLDDFIDELQASKDNQDADDPNTITTDDMP